MNFFKKLFGIKDKEDINKVHEVMKETPNVKEISVDDLKKKIDNKEDFTLVDVRTESELNYGKIKCKQFKFIPMQEIESREKELDKNKEVITYCRTGHRSHSVAQDLMKHGFKKVSTVKDGLMAWRKYDKSIEPY